MHFFKKGHFYTYKKRRCFFLLFLVFAGLTLFTACAPVPEEETPAADLFFGAEKVLEEETGQTYATITVTVPDSVYGALADPELRQKISLRLEQIGMDFLDSRQLEAESQKQANPAYQGEYSLHVELFYADSTMVSLRAEVYASVSGAAHPVLTARGYTFDSDGEPVDLASLLGADYLETVPAAILSQIEANGELANYYPDLAQLLPQGLSADKWYADEQFVYLIYDPYEIAAYAMGVQEFAVERVSGAEAMTENISFSVGTFCRVAPSNEESNPLAR